MTQRSGLGGHHQSLLTLVQMRKYRVELRPQRRHHIRIDRHYHIMTYRIPDSVVIYRRALTAVIGVGEVPGSGRGLSGRALDGVAPGASPQPQDRAEQGGGEGPSARPHRTGQTLEGSTDEAAFPAPHPARGPPRRSTPPLQPRWRGAPRGQGQRPARAPLPRPGRVPRVQGREPVPQGRAAPWTRGKPGRTRAPPPTP